MARILRLSPVQRNICICIGLVIVTNVLIVFEYTSPRKVALSLDETYDPLHSDEDFRSKNVSRILLVSALFILPKSEALKEEYLALLPRFLGLITTDTYFYTTPDLEPSVRAARGPGLPLTIDTSFSSPFDVPPLGGRETVYSRMLAHDKDRDLHGPELYAVRNAKPFFVDHAIRSLNGMEYDYVFWNDAGSFREDHVYSAWPDPARVEKIWKDGTTLSRTKTDELVFFPMNNNPPKKAKDWMEDLGPLETDFSQGSFFGGSPASMLWFSQAFYSYHDHFVKLGFFSGNDRTIYNALLLLYPSRFITVWVQDPAAPAHGGLPPGFLGHGYLGACGPEQYYYQWWLSDRETREKMRDWWMIHDRDPSKSAWWKTKIPCRLTTVLGIEGVLKRTFGGGWEAPVGTVTKPTRTW
ncbi:hypothetical protein GALMADRAFT_140114 [Galerina marginata CBS 339.88]|uniref:Uncharacterized protein n=1 Tax=Galerina marginata (strain CBS 339.88) TaxID=685588 RepID=A0A067T6E5_GALM3|nr:hypothetical protein GALMADRAFT_140114 [Galerina marginata CBS 339.88]